MKERKHRDQPGPVRRDGALCIYFVNTLTTQRRSFETYRELVSWGVASGVLVGSDRERLERMAVERADTAAEVLQRGLDLRHNLRRMLLAVAGRQSLPVADLEALNLELTIAFSARRLTEASGPSTKTGSRCLWVWGNRDGHDLDRMLWPVVSCAADLLSKTASHKVRVCAAEGCDVMFVDRTSGSPRKWCGPKCGNRVRALRDYHRRVKPMNERMEKERKRLGEEGLARRLAGKT